MSATLPDTTLTLNSTSSIPIGDYPFSYIDWIVLINASPYACTSTLGGYKFLLPAWYYYPVQVHDNNGNLLSGISVPFSVLPYLQTIPGVGFTSTLQSALYMRGESPPNTNPTPLGGGPIDLTQASNVVNVNSPAFTSVVFARPIGDTSSLGALNLENSGFGQFGDATNQGQITMSGPSGNSITITNDDVTLVLGSISRISKFSGTANTTPTFFNHGLGVAPDVVMIVGNGTSATLHTFFVDYTTFTATQAKITNDSAGGTPFVALAIKF